MMILPKGFFPSWGISWRVGLLSIPLRWLENSLYSVYLQIESFEWCTNLQTHRKSFELSKHNYFIPCCLFLLCIVFQCIECSVPFCFLNVFLFLVFSIGLCLVIFTFLTFCWWLHSDWLPLRGTSEKTSL